MNAIENTVESSRTKLLNVVDIEAVKGILEAFNETTKLMTNIVDTDGRSIFSRQHFSKCCSFCKLIYGMKGGLERCREAYRRYGKQAAILGEPHIFRCPAGLVEWAAPLIVDSEHLGSVICGQVLMWQPDNFFWAELRELNCGLTDDYTLLFESVKELPVISSSAVQGASYLMQIIANHIVMSDQNRQVCTKATGHQQPLPRWEGGGGQQLQKELGERPTAYVFAEEQELMCKVKLAEADAAQVLMQKLLVDIVAMSGNDIDFVRTSILELCVLISRSAVEAGVDLKQSIDNDSRMLDDIHKQTTIDAICVRAQIALAYYLECVAARREQPSHCKVNEIKKTIRENYRSDLTLEQIAESVYLSPSYASRLFKKVQNCSIMEYLTETRIEAAKRLLQNPRYPVSEVAANVGYADASYFAKVFHRNEGVTPTQYRNM
ncbi:MAG: PocR ligand-binding domain-containing protein [Actinomycetia bacterium]|nr:PocR ligand-binding domain-containing protein [Actinomycetes bacterium]